MDNKELKKEIIGVFAFDGPMFCDINGVYCNTTITEEMLSRYLAVVDKLIVAIRTFHIDIDYKTAKLSPISNRRIVIYELPNFNSPINFILKFKWYSHISKLVNDGDLFFLRMPSIISNMFAQACIKENKKYLVEVGGCAWDSYWNHGFLGKVCAPYMYLCEKYYIKKSSFASYVTKRWLQKRYPCNCINIVASNVYLPKYDINNLNSRLKIIKNYPKSRYKAATVAAIDVKYKGQQYMIKAIPLLNKKGIYIDYFLIGKGEKKYLERIVEKCKVKDQVHFCGMMLHEDVIERYDDIDLYIQPSKQEGLPRSLIEAMSKGCLCFGSNVAGIPELLEEDCIFKSVKPSEIANTISKKLENDTENVARQNFYKAKEYSKEYLDKKRNKLYLYYANEVSNN